jgi:hypothetical protein
LMPPEMLKHFGVDVETVVSRFHGVLLPRHRRGRSRVRALRRPPICHPLQPVATQVHR